MSDIFENFLQSDVHQNDEKVDLTEHYKNHHYECNNIIYSRLPGKDEVLCASLSMHGATKGLNLEINMDGI